MRISGLILVLVLLSGCQHPPANHIPATKLAGLVANADHIVVTYKLPPWNSPIPVPPPENYRHFSLIISGDQASKIVDAVSTAQPLCAPPCTDSAWPWDLQFYQDTHLLAEIHTQSSNFVFENGEYYAGGKALKQLDEELYQRTTSPNER